MARSRSPPPGDHRGHPRVVDAHFPPAAAGALDRTPRPRTSSEAAFLALGDGATLWLTEAAATGAGRVRAKMAEAVELARLHGDTVVDRALGQAGASGRFAEGDLAAILSHQATALPGPAGRAGEGHTLAQGTAGWAGFGDPDLGQTGFGETEVTRSAAPRAAVRASDSPPWAPMSPTS